jgi:hypothetical protein
MSLLKILAQLFLEMQEVLEELFFSVASICVMMTAGNIN